MKLMLFRRKALAADGIINSDDNHWPQLSMESLNMKGDITSNLHALQIKIVNWSYSWGPENLWEKRFNDLGGVGHCFA
jgi:hypothetical protein